MRTNGFEYTFMVRVYRGNGSRLTNLATEFERTKKRLACWALKLQPYNFLLFIAPEIHTKMLTDSPNYPQ